MIQTIVYYQTVHGEWTLNVYEIFEIMFISWEVDKLTLTLTVMGLFSIVPQTKEVV